MEVGTKNWFLTTSTHFKQYLTRNCNDGLTLTPSGHYRQEFGFSTGRKDEEGIETSPGSLKRISRVNDRATLESKA